MNAQAKFSAVALVAAVLALLTPTTASAYASAPLTVCNKINVRVILAFGYHSPGVQDPADHSLLTGPFVSQGWRYVEPAQCITFDNPFGARYMYWYAASLMGHPMNDDDLLATRNADAPQHFCINNYIYAAGTGTPAFTAVAAQFVYEDQNVSAASCDTDATMKAHNFWVTAHEVDTWVNANVDYTPEMVSNR